MRKIAVIWRGSKFSGINKKAIDYWNANAITQSVLPNVKITLGEDGEGGGRGGGRKKEKHRERESGVTVHTRY